jgi:hypothetical protein
MERPEAIIAYSIEVAPRSSRRKRPSTAKAARVEDLNMASLPLVGILASQQHHEVRDQRLVGGRHGVVAQVVRSHPFEPLPLPRFG